MLELADPDVAWWNREDDPGAPVSRGHDGLRTGMAELDELAELRVEPQEFIDAGEYVVVPVRVVGRGRASGASFEEQEVHVFRLREGKVSEGREFREKGEALKAAGLEESSLSENEEFVRSLYDRFNAGERLPEPDAWHADGVYVTSSDDPDSDTYSGVEEITQQFQRWLEAYPDLRVDPLEVLVNRDRVLVWGHWSGHGAGSQVPIEMEMAQVYTLDDGKIRRIEEYFNRDEALKAAGLQE